MRGKRKRCELARLLPSLTKAGRGWGQLGGDCRLAPRLGLSSPNEVATDHPCPRSQSGIRTVT